MKSTATERVRRVVGCMTGSSIDGIDAALIEVRGTGLDMHAAFVRGVSHALGDLAPRLRSLAEQQPTTAGEVAQLAHDFSSAHIRAMADLLQREACDLICVHGQTVFHKPPLTWQLMQPSTIAHALRTPVVYDLRQADLAAGGQGAPLTPLADWVLFRRRNEAGAVVNLGGFANFTHWTGNDSSSAGIQGGDICACNQLLDALARLHLGEPYDIDGRVAASGGSDPAHLDALMSLLAAQSQSARSLGTGDELEAWAAATRVLDAPTALRTACEAIAATIAGRISSGTRVLVGGGGERNRTLMYELGRHMPQGVHSTNQAGVPPGFREAAGWGVLGALAQDRVAVSVPAVTGCPTPAPLAGAWVFV